MNRLPYATALISASVAVILWLLATWLERDQTWLQEGPIPGTDPSFAQPRTDTPIRTNADAAGCEQAEGLLREQVAQAQQCITDDDCTLFDYGYPIQCLTSVAMSKVSDLRRQYREYHASCEYRVYYDCPTGEMERQAKCKNNRCAVELNSNDLLKQQTLDYLGIE